ncbi:MAG TPA: type II secretion system protein [Bryobacteraceae bacterium]
MTRRGFTLLEMLIATAIMGVAVVGLLSNLSTSLRNAARLTDYDRATVLAREKMDELLLDSRLPRRVPLEGAFDRNLTGETEMEWRARLTPFEMPPNAGVGTIILDRVELEVYWGPDGNRRTLALEGFRQSKLTAAEVPAQ